MMPSKFKNILNDFETYSKEVQLFVGEIQRGSNQLHDYISVLESAIAHHDSPIIPKILSMRFARDIMILGRQDVVGQLVRLVPHLVKICSHRLQSSDPNRGQSYFYSHKQYIQARSSEQKKQIQLYGSTYFTLCLESINRWAKWIPVDSKGNQSKYSQGYNQLLQRGVKFQNIFHYYKNADTDKFKNTYKVQFFTQSEYENESNSSQRLGQSLSSRVSSTTIFDVHNSEDVRNYLLNHKISQKPSKNDPLQKLFKKVTAMYEQFNTNYPHKLSPPQNQQKKYYEKFLLNYTLLQNNKLPIQKFIKIMSAQQLQLQPQKQQFQSTPKKLTSKPIDTSKNKQYYESLLQKQQESWNQKINFLKKELDDRSKQLQTIKTRNIQDIEIVKQEYEERIRLIKKGVIDGSGQKTRYLYQENQALKSKINQLEQKQLSQHDESLQNERQRYLQMQNIKLGRELQQLKIDNQKLKNTKKSPNIITSMTNNEFNTELQQLHTILKQKQHQSKQYQQKLNELTTGLPQKQKKINNLTNQLKMYKKQLTDERQINRKEKQRNQKTIIQLENQLRAAKDKILYLEKKNDLMELEAAELQEQVKLCKLMDRETNIMLKNMAVESHQKVFIKKDRFSSSQMSNQSAYKQHSRQLASPHKMMPSSPKNNPHTLTFKYKKFQTLRNTLYRRNKEQWYRLVKSTLKTKDILLKQQQLEIGIISNKENQVTQYGAVLFFTNVSDHQIDNLQINAFSQQSLLSQKNDSLSSNNSKIQPDQFFELGTNFIFCLQSHQQQKIQLTYHNKNPITKIYQPAYLQIHYTKNTKNYKHRIVLPYFLFKSIQYSSAMKSKYATQIFTQSKDKFEDENVKIDRSQEQFYGVKFYYSQNIVPENKYIYNYFPGIEKVQGKNSDADIEKFVGLAKVKGYEVEFVMKLELRSDHVMKVRLLPLRNKAYKDTENVSIEQEVYRDFLSFMEFAFRR